jgi:hypothetical protein
LLSENSNNDKAIEMLIQAKGLTAPRITPDQIDALLDRVGVMAHVIEGTTVTVGHAFLDGKYYLGSAHSATVSPENFDEQIGLQICRDKIYQQVRNQLWELEGYRLYREMNPDPVPEPDSADEASED